MRKQVVAIFTFLILLFVLCSAFYTPVIHKLPFGFHEWAQADRYALAVKFYDNGMNLFKPATYAAGSVDGVVGVEFPIQAYIAAALGKIFGREHIALCFRLTGIFILCTGLLFLFLTSFRATKDFLLSLIAPIIIFSSPAFIDYSGNFIPDPAAVSISFIAFYFLFNYIEKNRQSDFYKIVLLLTLATLIKTSVGLYLAGFCLYVFLERIGRLKTFPRRQNISMAATVLGCFAVIVGYIFYNRHLNEKYHSTLFFASIAPFDSWKEVGVFLQVGIKANMYEYFSIPTYVLLCTIIVPGMVLLANNITGKKHLSLIGIFLFGALCMMGLFGKQLTIHDYYLISILFPLLGYSLVSSAVFMYRAVDSGLHRKAFRASTIATLLFTCFFTDYYLAKRRAPVYLPYSQWYRYFWMAGGDKVMDKAGILKTETILALHEEAPNLTSVYMDRNSLTYPWYQWDRLNADPVKQFMRDNNIRFAVCEAKAVKDMETLTPGIFKDFSITEEGQIAVLKLNK